MRMSPQLLCPATSSGGVPLSSRPHCTRLAAPRAFGIVPVSSRGIPKERKPAASEDRPRRSHLSFRISGVCRDRDPEGLCAAIPIV